MNQENLPGNPGQVQSLGNGRFSAAHDGNRFLPEEAAVAAGTVADSVPGKRRFLGESQLSGCSARGKDHCPAEITVPSGCFRCHRFLFQAQRPNLLKPDFRPEPFRLPVQISGQREPVDLLRNAGIVGNPVRQRHLPAGNRFFQQQNRQSGSGTVNRSGISSGTSADDQHIKKIHVCCPPFCVV